MRPIADPYFDRDAPGVKRCDTCDQVIEGQVFKIGDWEFCEEHYLAEIGQLSA